MPPVNRNEPKRAPSSQSDYSLMEYMREFPDDAACLDFLWRERFAQDGQTADCPKCKQPRRFHRVASRPSYSCDHCGHHLHPTAGTIFHKSSTSLHLWFYAMYLMSSTRCGVSAKQLERELGVTYKTAWRMANLIRNKLMCQDPEGQLSGEVEIDETAVGGKPRASDGPMTRQQGVIWAKRKKTTVVGMVERKGRVKATVASAREGQPVAGIVYEHVLPSSVVFTDEWVGYKGLGDRYQAHRRIRHADRVYVEGDVHTNTIEGFFGLFKNGVRGTYHAVSRKWLQGYLNEFTWRYNRRHDDRAMFKTLLLRAAT